MRVRLHKLCIDIMTLWQFMRANYILEKHSLVLFIMTVHFLWHYNYVSNSYFLLLKRLPKSKVWALKEISDLMSCLCAMNVHIIQHNACFWCFDDDLDKIIHYRISIFTYQCGSYWNIMGECGSEAAWLYRTTQHILEIDFENVLSFIKSMKTEFDFLSKLRNLYILQ